MCGSSHRVPEKEITARWAESVARSNGSLESPERVKVLKYMELKFRLAHELAQDLGLSERICDSPEGFREIWDEQRDFSKDLEGFGTIWEDFERIWKDSNDFERIWTDLGRSGMILKGSGRICRSFGGLWLSGIV